MEEVLTDVDTSSRRNLLDVLRLRDERAARALPTSQALDGLRGFALLLVLATHLGIPGQKSGYAAVVLFFVLSGFLITTLLLRGSDHNDQGRPPLREFYVRRYYRLAPELALCLLLCAPFAASLMYDHQPASFYRAVIGVITLSYNWLLIADPNVNGGLGHLWTLAIEEQFYLAWPVVLSILLVTFRRRPAIPLALVGAGGFFVVVWRAIAYTPVAYPAMPPAYWGSLARIDALLLGCALALLRRQYPVLGQSGRRALEAMAWPALILIVLLGVASREAQQSFFVPYGLAAAVVLSLVVTAACLWVPAGRFVRTLSAPILVASGILSYGLYLYHQPVIFIARDLLPQVADRLRYRVPFDLVVTALLALGSYHTAGAWGRRRRSRRSGSTEAAPTEPAV